MQRTKRWTLVGCGLALAAALAGCHGRSQPPPPANPYPGGVTAAQMQQGIAQISNNPQMTPQQKMAAISVLRSHVKVVPDGGGAK